MNEISEELTEIAEQLDVIRVKFDSEEVRAPTQKLEDSVNKIGKAWSGSWLGYHSRVYYRDFQPPPPGARFSQEWGLRDVSFGDTIGQWVEYDLTMYERKSFIALVIQVYKLGGNLLKPHVLPSMTSV